MSETMTTVARPRRGGLILAAVGLALVAIAMIFVALVLIDKEHFGELVGTMFLQVITSGVIVGSLMMLVGALMLPQRWTWRGIVLIVWSLIALTSPLFGFLFLAPWAVMLVTLPVAIVALVGLYKGT
jgi:hypothetical protein